MWIGVRRGSSVEWCVPVDMRARWFRDGGRILREEPGEVTTLVLRSEFAPPASVPEPTPQAPEVGPPRKGGRPAGSKTRRGSQGGDAAIVESVER